MNYLGRFHLISGINRNRSLMLGIIIGVASVVIMVSVVQGSNRKTMEYYEKLGDNKISVNIYGTITYVDMGNGVSMGVSSGSTVDSSQLLYDFCEKNKNGSKA